MKEKINNLIKHPFVQQFRDMRALGLAAFGVIALLVTWSGIKAVQTNFELQKQISQLEQENEIKELENANQDLRNQYLETDQFLELSARQQFGLAAPGEKVLLVSRDVALSYVTIPPENSDSEESETKSRYQRNFEEWMSFFLNRR